MSFSQDQRFQHYTLEDGLPSSTVYRVHQDNKGYIWFASEGGVSRFDGTKFTNFTIKDSLPDNIILDIYEDKKGRLWFCGYNGRVGYYISNSFHIFNPNGILNDFKVSKISVDNEGIVWLGSRMNGLISYSKDTVKHYHIGNILPDNYAGAVQDLDGTIWISTRKEYGYIDSLGIFQFVSLNDSVVEGPLTIKVCKNGEILAFNKKNILELRKDRYKIIFPKKPDNKLIINTLNEGQEGNLLVATNSGALLLKPRGNQYIQTNFPIKKDVGTVIQDNERDYWFTTLNKGVFFLSSNGYWINDILMPDNAITASNVFKEQIFLGSSNGILYLLDSDTIYKIDLRIPGEPKYINDLKIYNHNLLCATDVGVFVIDIQKLRQGLPDSSIADFKKPQSISVIDISKSIKLMWLGSVKAIQLVDSSMFATSTSGLFKINLTNKLKIECLNSARMLSITTVGNHLWLGTEAGLYEYKDNFLQKPTGSMLFNTQIKDMVVNQHGLVWAATIGHGIFAFKNSEIKYHLTTADGLSSDHVNKLLIGKAFLWAATNRGISRISLADHHDILRINVADGLPSNEIFDLDVIDTIIYASTASGLCVFNGKAMSKNTNPPPVYITNFSIWDRDTAVVDHILLDHTNNNLSIRFTALSYNDQVNYLFKMEGIDKDWQHTNMSYVKYPLLSPGNYNFLVKAVNADGIKSLRPASMHITITSPFWQTTWFLISVLATLTGLIYMIIFFRVRKFKKRAEEKATIDSMVANFKMKSLQAQMNPHFISNALNSINHFILNHDDESASSYLAKFSKLMRLVLDASRKDYVTLADELRTMELYCELESVRFEGKISYKITIDPIIKPDDVIVPSMLLQPFIENAIIHGLAKKTSPGHLTVNIATKNQHLYCEIIDDGIGRIQSKRKKLSHQSHGMSIINEKLEILKKSNNIDIKTNIIDLFNPTGEIAGTKVLLIIPLESY